MKKVLKAIWSVISNKEYRPEEKSMGVATATAVLLSIGASAGLVKFITTLISLS